MSGDGLDLTMVDFGFVAVVVISLGNVLQQIVEAIGCLGDAKLDWIAGWRCCQALKPIGVLQELFALGKGKEQLDTFAGFLVDKVVCGQVCNYL